MATKTNSPKILLCLPLILLTSNATGMKLKYRDKIKKQPKKEIIIQKIIKKVLVSMLCISDELSSKINEETLPLQGKFSTLNCPKLNKEIFCALPNYYLYVEDPKIIGATLEELKDLEKSENPYTKKDVRITDRHKFLTVETLYEPEITLKIINKNNDKVLKFCNIKGFCVSDKDENVLELTLNTKPKILFVNGETGKQSYCLEDLV